MNPLRHAGAAFCALILCASPAVADEPTDATVNAPTKGVVVSTQVKSATASGSLAASPPAAARAPDPGAVASPRRACESARCGGDEEKPDVISDDGQPVPAGYHRASRVRRGLVISGSIVFGIMYGSSTLAATASPDDRDRTLFVPVVGPVIDLAMRGCPSNSSGDDSCHISQRVLAFDAIGQGVGAALLIAGLVAQREVFVRDFSDASATPPAWGVAPSRVGQSGWGVAAGGTF